MHLMPELLHGPQNQNYINKPTIIILVRQQNDDKKFYYLINLIVPMNSILTIDPVTDLICVDGFTSCVIDNSSTPAL